MIRNRLSHPKRPEHLVVSADDIETVEKAMVWFMVTFLNLMPFSKLTQEEMGMLMAHAAKV